MYIVYFFSFLGRSFAGTLRNGRNLSVCERKFFFKGRRTKVTPVDILVIKPRAGSGSGRPVTNET